jgi:hypothetical protein
MGEIFAHVSMHNRIPFADNRMCLISKTAAIVERALDEWPMTRTKSVNVLPRSSRIEGEFIWRSANYGSILLVQLEDLVWLASSQEPVRVWNITPGGQEWSRETIQGVVNMSPNHNAGDERETLSSISIHWPGNEVIRPHQQRERQTGRWNNTGDMNDGIHLEVTSKTNNSTIKRQRACSL